MTDKNLGWNLPQNGVEMRPDPPSLWNDSSLRFQSAYPGNELVVRSCMIRQNRDCPDLQRRQKVTVLLLRGTDSNQDPVTWHDFFFPQFKRQKINESIQSRIRQNSVAREAPVDQCRDARLELGSFSKRLNKIHYQLQRIENRRVNVSRGGIVWIPSFFSKARCSW